MAEKRVRVVATGNGYDGICLREPGDTFDLPASAVEIGATWFHAVDPKAKNPPADASDVV